MIILLNGSSSSGKSSIAKELQVLFDDIYLGIGIDKFMSMVPSTFQGYGEKSTKMWSWKKNSHDHGQFVSLKLGTQGKSFILGMYESIEIMAKQ